MALDIPLPGDKSYNFITVFWKMAQRHCMVYKTSKCSSDTYASSSLSSDFMWNIDIFGWKNWQSPLVSDQSAEMTWFDPGYLLGPQSSMCVVSETVYSDPKSLLLLITTGTRERLGRWEGATLIWTISCCLCRLSQFFHISSICAWFLFTTLVINISLK